VQVHKFKGSPDEYKVIHDICYGCGSESIKKTYPYIRAAAWQGGKKFFLDVFGGKAFFAAIRSKSHIRLIGIAVMSDIQQKGLGRRIMLYEMKKARFFDIAEITLRTSKTENGVAFWKSMGAVITGEKGEDWEMRLRF